MARTNVKSVVRFSLLVHFVADKRFEHGAYLTPYKTYRVSETLVAGQIADEIVDDDGDKITVCLGSLGCPHIGGARWIEGEAPPPPKPRPVLKFGRPRRLKL